jgi:hypothetical protein
VFLSSSAVTYRFDVETAAAAFAVTIRSSGAKFVPSSHKTVYCPAVAGAVRVFA